MPQPALVGVPVPGTTPQPYVSAADAIARLDAQWGLVPTPQLRPGHMLSASMLLDQESPFQGVKLNVEQDREWPRSFKYGWPTIIGTPSPTMVSDTYPGAWYLDYEAVVPQQIVDWVCLKAYLMVTLPLERATTQESVTGASVHYAAPLGTAGAAPSALEEIMVGLISPFLVRQGHTAPFVNFRSF